MDGSDGMLAAPITQALGAVALTLGAAAAARRLVLRRGGIARLGFEAAANRIAGPDDTICIIDFDRTITDGSSAQCHDVIGAGAIMPTAIHAGFGPLLDFSKPEKVLKGDAWWYRANELLLEHARDVLTPESVTSLALAAPLFGTSTQPMRLRDGAASLLSQLDELNVPVLIVSAGFTEVIQAFLQANRVQLGRNVRVCSNRLVFASGRLHAIEPTPPITGYNKHMTYERNREWFEAHPTRRSLLVVGDSLGDLKCAEGVPADYRVTSVGIFNEADGRSTVEQYEEAFTAVVVGNGGSLKPVYDLVVGRR